MRCAVEHGRNSVSIGFVVKHKRSLKKRWNKIGEITEPCGIPEFTEYKLELIPINYNTN